MLNEHKIRVHTSSRTSILYGNAVGKYLFIYSFPIIFSKEKKKTNLTYNKYEFNLIKLKYLKNALHQTSI